MRYEERDIDGQGLRRVYVYDVRCVDPGNYWSSVTDVPCPRQCIGLVRWAEAGYVPGYRICDRCGAHYIASGTTLLPELVRVPGRRGKMRRDEA